MAPVTLLSPNAPVSWATPAAPPRRRIELPVEWLLLGASLFWALAVNGLFFGAALKGREFGDPAAWGFGAALFVALVALHFLLLAPLANRWTIKPLLAAVILVTAFAAHFMQQFGVYLDPSMMRNVMRTDEAEARELFAWSLLPHLLLNAVLPLLLLWRVQVQPRPWGRAAAVRLGSVLLATVALVGATTQNPSFALTTALVSRSRLFALEPLTAAQVATILERALADREQGLGGAEVTIAADALAFLAESADGDARRPTPRSNTGATASTSTQAARVFPAGSTSAQAARAFPAGSTSAAASAPADARRNARTGIASSSSLASRTPSMVAGHAVSQRTRPSACGQSRAMRSRWRAASSPETSTIRYSVSGKPSVASSSSTCTASAPLPAPNSTTRCAQSANHWAHCRARQRPNRSESSGAVTKSPAAPNLRLPPA